MTVAVFRGESAREIADTAMACGVAAVQLHGNYTVDDFEFLRNFPLKLVRAVRATTNGGGELPHSGDLGEDMLLVDSSVPGSGQSWDWSEWVARRSEKNWLLAGGLRPDNIAEAIEMLAPWGVDVSSGVERSRGVKEPRLIREFVSAAKSAARSLLPN